MDSELVETGEGGTPSATRAGGSGGGGPHSISANHSNGYLHPEKFWRPHHGGARMVLRSDTGCSRGDVVPALGLASPTIRHIFRLAAFLRLIFGCAFRLACIVRSLTKSILDLAATSRLIAGCPLRGMAADL